MQTIDKGHGRLEVRQLRVSTELVGYSDMPGLAQVAEVRTRRITSKTGQRQEQVHYLFTSLPPAQAPPGRLLALSRGHWGIENQLFHVKDDSFGEDRHVLQRRSSGINMSALRNIALALLRGQSRLWQDPDPLTARAQYVCARPIAVLAKEIGS
jgi:predicted transposase YbfD/YdcC